MLYDPAGTFTHPDLPRRGDVHYGMTPRYVDYYERYHARFDYFVEAQKVPVSRAAADQLIANAQAEGQRMKMTCSLAIADVLRPVPPFTGVPVSFFPEALRGELRRAIPGCRQLRLRDPTSARTRSGSTATRRSHDRPSRERMPDAPAARGPPARRTGGGRAILAGLAAGRAEGERVYFGDMVDAFDARAYGPLIVLFAAPNILPVALPGISAVLGAPLILLTAQLELGMHAARGCPGFLRRRSLARSSFQSLVDRIVPRLHCASSG